MTTYGAYRHVELDKIGRGKKRVNYPPGGAAKIEEEVVREPKTVRVLKPPGGGSSISFTDDHNQQGQRTTVNGTASKSLQETPSSAVQDLSPISPSVSEEKETTSTENDASANSTNGTATKESPAEPSSPKPDLPLQTSSDVGLSNENYTLGVSCNGADTSSLNSTTIENQINGQNSQVEHEHIVQEVVTTCVNESKEVTSTSNESHQITTQISSGDHVEAVEKNESVTATEEIQNHEPKQNRTTTVNGEKYSSDSSRPAQVSSTYPSSCAPNSQSKDGQDNADRKLSQPAVTPNPTPQPRKIKDHMRSNIFMSDEDYTPTRSSRMNAAVVTESPPTGAAAGQRQRIPPGGFSTKLW